MGIAEKKAFRELQEKFEKESLQKMKKATGSEAITATFELDEKCEANQIQTASDNVNDDFVNAFVRVCEDADYREEIAKIKKYTFKIVPLIAESVQMIYAIFKLDANELTVTVDGTHMASGNDAGAIPKVLKKLF